MRSPFMNYEGKGQCKQKQPGKTYLLLVRKIGFKLRVKNNHIHSMAKVPVLVHTEYSTFNYSASVFFSRQQRTPPPVFSLRL